MSNVVTMTVAMAT